MDLYQWSKSNADYGRRLLDSGIEGVRSGQEAFLHGQPLTPLLSESVRSALIPGIVGACIGVLSSYTAYRQRSITRALGFGVLGGAACLGAGIVWENRRLTASVAESAVRSIGKVRDEHWLAKHPIDYA